MSFLDFLPSELFTSAVLPLAKVTVVLTVAWMTHMMLRRRNPGWRILIWRISGIGLFGVAILSFNTPFYTMRLLPAISVKPAARNSVASTISSTSPTGRDVGKSQSAAIDQISSDHQVPTNRHQFAGDPTGAIVSSIEEPTVLESQHFPLPSWGLPMWTLLTWSTGVFLGLFRLLVGIERMAKIRRRSIVVPDWVVSEFVRINSCGLSAHRVQVLQTKGVTAPCSVGLWYKSILLPSAMCDKTRVSEIRATLAHEVVHFTGHDLQWNFVLHVLSVMLWFHPMAWRIRWAHADACDQRCDAVAANCLQDVEGYGRLLARIALQASGRTPTTALPMARVSNITSRIEMIRSGVGNHKLQNWKTRSASIISAALILLLGTVGVSRSTAEAVAEFQAVVDNDRAVAITSEASDEIEPVPIESDVPKLIAVWPGNGAEKVDPDTELHLRFDRPIDPLSFTLEWRQGSYLDCGNTRYLKDKNELVIPIHLEAGRQHSIAINSHDLGHRANGFVSTDGLAVASTEWQFHTKATKHPVDQQQPKVVSIHPPLGSKVARVALVRIRFDQAMDPLTFDFPNRQPARIGGIEFNSCVSYDDENNEFLFPVVLPANWNGQIELGGLKSRNGIAVDPITIRYSTEDNLFSQEDLNRLMQPDALAKLRNVVDKVQLARRDLQSVSETVHAVTFGGNGIRGRGFSRLEGNWSRFKMQGERQFYGDVSQIMGIPFQIGSDGIQCWFFSHRPSDEGQMTPTLITCEYKDIQNKNLSFVEPLDFDVPNLDQVVKDRRLEYVGLERIDGTDCHLIRSLDVHKLGSSDSIFLMVQHWWIDSDTFRPLQVTTDFSGGRTIKRFRYDSINRQLPMIEFQPTMTARTIQRKPDPLGDGYDVQFLKVGDGTNGRMSCRWGKTGKKGRSSSGLN